MRFRSFIVAAALLVLNACTGNARQEKATGEKENAVAAKETSAKGAKHFEGMFSNGMKGDKISFDISEDGKKLENLTFTGYWRCSGKLESVTAGPEGAFDVNNNKVSGHISEPPNGGSTAWRFDLDANIDGNNASGTFRMNINNLGCDSYVLKWTATAK